MGLWGLGGAAKCSYRVACFKRFAGVEGVWYLARLLGLSVPCWLGLLEGTTRSVHWAADAAC